MKLGRKFGIKDLGRQDGKYALVTGANSGLGYEVALALATLGANVVMVCRSAERGHNAMEAIRMESGNASLRLKIADLEDIQAIRSLAGELENELPHLNILINNAGIMNIPQRELTSYGLERQMAVNHFAPFALTNALLPLMWRAVKPRVVAVSSIAAYYAHFTLDNINGGQHYTPHAAYCNTKFANILFANELGRREEWLTSVIAHPGVTHTGIQREMKGASKELFQAFQKTMGQSAWDGAKAILIAATIPSARSGMYFGPRYMLRGPVDIVRQPKAAQNTRLAKHFWEASEEMLST